MRKRVADSKAVMSKTGDPMCSGVLAMWSLGGRIVVVSVRGVRGDPCLLPHPLASIAKRVHLILSALYI